jgi:hypothetical protein
MSASWVEKWRTYLFICIPDHFVGFINEHIEQGRLAMVEMAHNSDVADHLGVGHHVEQKPFVEARLWQALFLNNPVAHFDRCNDRLCKRLGILLLDEGLDIGAVPAHVSA